MKVADRVAVILRAGGSVWAQEEAAILVEAAAGGSGLAALVARRSAGEPLETVVGWVDFLDRRLVVVPGVFVPRRRTELLARTALARMGSCRVVVEMCCGVAPVAAVLEDLATDLHAADLSETALECAALNAPNARLHLGDLFEALPAGLTGAVDMLVANAPYVPSDCISTMPREARDHEPLLALDGGSDGVDLHRRLAEGSRMWLRPGGVLLLETSRDQLRLTTDAMREVGLRVEAEMDDEIGGCVVIGVKEAGPV